MGAAGADAPPAQLYDLPRQSRSDEGIARIIDRVVPNSSFARTAVARNVKDLPDLIDEHGHAVRKLEKILARYLGNLDRLPAARPECRPSKKDRAWDTYPRGQRLDAIDYYTQRIRDLEVEIREVRAGVDKRGTMAYGFASYSDIAEAHSIAHACGRGTRRTQGATVTLAPRPGDIIWRNMALSRATRSRRRWVNNFWIAVLTLLWVGPNAMIAIFLVNLGNLAKVWPAFRASMAANTVFWGMVQGILSPALMSLVYLVLPIVFRRLSVQAGDQTKTGRERHVLAKMYSFFVFNNLVVFSFFSTTWTFVAAIVEQTKKGADAWAAVRDAHIADGVFQAFCNNSPFWVTYLLQRQLGATIDLAQIWPLIQVFLKKLSSPTPRELIELTAPPPFEYASYYNYFLFYATVTLCFAGIQPLVLPATAAYFCIDSYVKKYLMLYRFVTKTESGGLFWRALFNRLVLATVLADLVVLLTCWVRGEATLAQFYAAAPLPFVMVAFKMYCRWAFDTKLRYYSTQRPGRMHEAALPKEGRPRGEKLSSRFGHPALYQPLTTPMVHQRAQNLLPSVYRGRLTDGREAGAAGDLASVSGYSDTYALDAMQKGGRPGKSASSVPGFEYVSEAHMDFAYYKNRADFAEHHGGGELYGRPATPGSVDDAGDGSPSRPASPLSGGRSTTPLSARRNASDTAYGGGARGRHPLYAHDNGSSSGLVRHAAGVPTSRPGHARDASADRGLVSGAASPPGGPGPSVGALGGGPRGYSGLAQSEDADGPEPDPTQYSYFRAGSRPVRPPGEGS